jgi:hypothetical protein
MNVTRPGFGAASFLEEDSNHAQPYPAERRARAVKMALSEPALDEIAPR